MINPFAQTFMIASRTEPRDPHRVAPRLVAARDVPTKARPRRFWSGRRWRLFDPKSL